EHSQHPGLLDTYQGMVGPSISIFGIKRTQCIYPAFIKHFEVTPWVSKGDNIVSYPIFFGYKIAYFQGFAFVKNLEIAVIAHIGGHIVAGLVRLAGKGFRLVSLPIMKHFKGITGVYIGYKIASYIKAGNCIGFLFYHLPMI